MSASSLVAIVAVAAPIDKTLDYLVPDELRCRAVVGMRLHVPLGRRTVVGYLLELSEGQREGLKTIRDVLDEAPLFSADMVPFFRRAADYYRHPIGEVIRTALPAGLSGAEDGVGILYDRLYTPTDMPGAPSGKRQQEILAHIRKKGGSLLSELREVFGSPHAPLNRLVELGFLSVSEEERLRNPFLGATLPEDPPVDLSYDQATAIEKVTEAIETGTYSALLLHGVTGSGKTEVYLRSIAHALERRRRALVLVPEIALTPQLVGRFRVRYAAAGKRIAVLHSGLSDGERYDAWRAIARGEIDIVIGARSAVFAPIADLGIVVVDEEHEGSYKQTEGFRYHARDLALLRGQMTGCSVLLGSATPALSTYRRAKTGQTEYLPLARRVLDRPLPEVTLVDLREERPEGALSQSLAAALRENLDRKEQSLLLLNRRGFSPFLLCADCGQTFRCPNCEITLTYHRSRRILLCHYCDHAAPPPDVCPKCGGASVEPQGAGTERLEEELSTLFPNARIGRMDRDTTTRKGAHQAMVSAMERGEIDILVGTQMVAKGLDFPGVTLVGVVSADVTLNFPDFRAGERTFALLTQVAGRAGRGERPGRVFVQTYNPESSPLVFAAAHDYEGFAASELPLREELGYPPFGFLVNLVLSGNDSAKVQKGADELTRFLCLRSKGVDVLGPAPCPLSRLRGKSRVQILLKSPERSFLRRLLAHLDQSPSLPSGVRISVDIDPLDML